MYNYRDHSINLSVIDYFYRHANIPSSKLVTISQATKPLTGLWRFYNPPTTPQRTLRQPPIDYSFHATEHIILTDVTDDHCTPSIVF